MGDEGTTSGSLDLLTWTLRLRDYREHPGPDVATAPGAPTP